MIANHQYVQNLANERMTCEKCGASAWDAKDRDFNLEITMGDQSVFMVCRRCGKGQYLENLTDEEAVKAGFDMSLPDDPEADGSRFPTAR